MENMILFLCLVASVFADTPANCTYEEVRGTWVFQIGGSGHDNTLNCSDFGSPSNLDEMSGKSTSVSVVVDVLDSSGSVISNMNPPISKLTVQLLFPDFAVDEFGNTGFWTLIYNQGVEVVITGHKYFAFSFYNQTGETVVSYCGQTFPGWSHDVFGRNWACYSGMKMEPVPPKVYKIPRVLTGLRYNANSTIVRDINKRQGSWKAVKYPHYDGMLIEDMVRMAGGRKSKILGIPKPAPVSAEHASLAASLPKSFDWRNVDGVNFVAPVRNQASCGSCYAFAAMAMNEARWRIMSNNTFQPIFSPQDVVECSEYSQGCEGGFPYLIAGKYAEDFGLVYEECNPYKGSDHQCSTIPNCPKLYSTKYEYVGGFYGACNEALMKINLVKNGPLAVAFEVYDDFFNYKSGIYHHTGLHDKFDPFEITNHAVLLVGYGTDFSNPASPQDYWIVKNSWGTSWGENGYFRIRRGNDECSIESIAVQSFPIM